MKEHKRSARKSHEAPGEITQIHTFPLGAEAIVGGVETWLKDYLQFGTQRYLLLGVGQDLNLPMRPLWPNTRIAAVSKANQSWLPDGLPFLLGVIKHRKLVTRTIFVHRVELVLPLRILFPRAKLVLFVRTNLHAQGNFDSGKRWQLRGPLYFLYERLAMKAPDLTVVLSRPDFSRIARLAGKALLADAWFNDQIYSGPDTQTKRSGILWVGRFEWQKDPLLAIRVFAASATLHSENMTMVGAGTLLEDAQQLIERLGVENRVTIKPAQTQETLASTFKKAKILLHTSFFEGAPRTLVEAAAQGLTLVTCRESDPEGIAVTEGLGVQAKGRSEAEFVVAIIEALSREQPEDVRKIASRAGSQYAPALEQKILDFLS